MKNRCAPFAIVLSSLLAFGLANADIEFAGVIDPSTTVTRIDSVILRLPDMTFLTPGWGSHYPYDTLIFAGVSAWPETLLLYDHVNGIPLRSRLVPPIPDTWYRLCLGIVVSQVKFFGTGYGSVEEPKPTTAPLARLTVSPSVVTGQMTVRLQPYGTGRPLVQIRDAVGNVVRSLDCTAGSDGVATATWNREDASGRLVPEGVYFCRYAAGDVIAVRKILVAH